MRLTKAQAVSIVVLIVLIALVALTGHERMPPTPPGSFSFAVLGDAPYYPWEEWRYRFVLKSLDESDLAFVVHIGDIWWRPCTDEHYLKTREQFQRLRPPVIFTPGDNEWADCWEAGSGGYQPLERLARLREIFFATPPRGLAAVRQPTFIENARWERDGVVFATVHLIGSLNGFKPFPGRTPADDAAAHERTEAAVMWMRETFARARDKKAVVLGFHANLAFEEPQYRRWYAPFTRALEEEVRRFGKPVLIVQGNNHDYIVDHPIRRLPNFTRMQVPGSPDVGWVRVTVTARAANPFAFEESIVPRWKYW